jgi:hypothetical protein
VIVLSLGAAMSFSFIGGAAKAKGDLKIAEGVKPVSFAATGGIAVLVIVVISFLLALASADDAHRVSFESILQRSAASSGGEVCTGCKQPAARACCPADLYVTCDLIRVPKKDEERLRKAGLVPPGD